MNKFKVGDKVVPRQFKTGELGATWIPEMIEYVGISGRIVDKTSGKEYLINDYWWPESALTLVEPDGYNDEEELFESLAHHMKKQMEKPLQTVVAEPGRKTLGDFMIAALNGMCSNERIMSDGATNIIAELAFRIGKAAFELYEKEVSP